MTAWHSGGIGDGTKFAVVDRQDLHTDVFRVISAGVRTGVPLELLDGYRAFHSLEGLLVVNERRARVEMLQAELTELETLEARTRKLAVAENNERARGGYEQDVRELGGRAEALLAEIAALQRIDPVAPLPDSVTGEVEYLLHGLAALLTPTGVVDKPAAAALRRVLDGFACEVVGEWVHWRTHLLVPADGRVLRLGPFRGRVPRRGRTLTPAEWQRLRTGAGRPAGRRGVIHALGKAGFPEHLARAASLAPDGHLARVLLGQDVEWPDVPAVFDHDRFNRHLRQQWGAHPGWAKGVYCQTNTKRQALTDLVAALGGFARADQLRAVFPDLGIKDADLLPMTLTRRARNPATADWPPSVERVGQWSAAGKAHEHAVCSILCPGCGQPATAVVRVLEVPGALLCRRCLIAPARPDLRFPPIYATLALPPTAIAPALVTRALATQIGTVTKGRKPRPRQSG